MAAINKNLTFSKRKPELLMDGGEVVEKRKKGRPRKDKMAAPITQPFTQVERRHIKIQDIFHNLKLLLSFLFQTKQL